MFYSKRKSKMRDYIGEEVLIIGKNYMAGKVGLLEALSSKENSVSIRIHPFFTEDHESALRVFVDLDDVALPSRSGNTFVDVCGTHYCEKCSEALRDVHVEISGWFEAFVFLETCGDKTPMHLEGRSRCKCGHPCLIEFVTDQVIEPKVNVLRERISVPTEKDLESCKLSISRLEQGNFLQRIAKVVQNLSSLRLVFRE